MVRSLRTDLAKIIKRYRHDAAYRELLHTSFRSLSVRGLGVTTGFLVTWLTARYFSPESLGVVSICLAILSLASVGSKLGYDVALMRFIAAFAQEQRLDSVKGIYITSMKRVLPLTILIALLLFVTAPYMANNFFHKPHLVFVLQINAIVLLPLTVLQIHAECLRALTRVGEYTFFQTAAISSLAVAGLLIALAIGLSDEVPVYIQFICISAAAMISTFRWFRVSGYFLRTTEHSVTAKALHQVAAPMFTTTIMQLLMSWAGTLVLAVYQPEATVGIYNALVRISVFTNITILAINGLMMTRFVAAFHSGNLTELKSQSHEATKLIFITALPLFVVLLAFPEQLLSIFGPDFVQYKKELFVLLAGQFIVVCAGLPSQLLNMTDRQHVLRNISIVAALVNVVSCLIFIPMYGMLGACWAQFVGTLVWNILCISSVSRRMNIITFIGLSSR
jgi:O-antigen/teichoic acid export membrane protein